MKGTLVALALLGLVVAWFYYTSDEEFQAPDLPAIKRTAETLATTLKGAAPTEPPPTPNIEATVQAQVTEAIQRMENTLIAHGITPIATPTPTHAVRPTPPIWPTVPPGTTPMPAALTNATTPQLSPTRNAPGPTIPPVATASRVVRTIETGMGKRVDVTVEGFADSPAIFNTLEQTINEAEQMLGVSYPAPKLQMTKAGQLQGGFCGHNQMSYNPRYQGEPYTVEASLIALRVDGNCDETFRSTAHEVAHTWFHGNDPQNWIDEGLANSIEIQMQEAHPSEGDNYRPRTYCATHRNIAELETARQTKNVSAQASGFSCNYTLGDGIFGALREHLGTEAFNQAIAELGRKAVNPNDRANNVEDVKRVLGLDARALEIIDTWYSGQPEMRIFRQLDLVDYTYPPTLDGQYLHFAGRIREPGIVHEPVLGNDNYCSQFHLNQGLSDPSPLTGPVDPLPVGWSHRSIPDAAIINSEINPASGEFSVTARVNNAQLLGRKDLSLQVASRVTVGQDGDCEEATIYSHILIESGRIPNQLKKVKHYHNDQIAWDWLPQVSNYQIHLSGKALPGSISFQDRDNYCGQIDLYRMDESGYHRISGVNPMLPAGQSWATTPGAEITSGSVDSDGRFEAIIQIWDANLLNHPHVVLEIEFESLLDRSTNQCASSETMGAVSLIGN